jgi:hypothetical protein
MQIGNGHGVQMQGSGSGASVAPNQIGQRHDNRTQDKIARDVNVVERGHGLTNQRLDRTHTSAMGEEGSHKQRETALQSAAVSQLGNQRQYLTVAQALNINNSANNAFNPRCSKCQFRSAIPSILKIHMKLIH